MDIENWSKGLVLQTVHTQAAQHLASWIGDVGCKLLVAELSCTGAISLDEEDSGLSICPWQDSHIAWMLGYTSRDVDL